MTRRRNSAASAGVLVGVPLERVLPRLDEVLAGRDRPPEELDRLGRLVERLVGIPAVGLLDEPDLVRAERRAVRLLGVLLVRAAEADVRPDRDQARPVVGPGLLDRGRDRLDVVAVLDPRRVPAVGLEPGDDVLATRPSRSARRAGCGCRRRGRRACRRRRWPARRRGLGRDALLEVAVRAERVRPVVDDVVAVAVELGRRGGRSAIAMPTAFAKPWPSGPVVASTPGVRPYSGWPGVRRAPLPEAS